MYTWVGIKTIDNVSKGTIIYKRNPAKTGYYIQYASMETGQYFYIDRPLKFIELADVEKDVIAFNLNIEANVKNKTEFMNISKSEIDEAAFEKANEKAFNFTSLKRYDSAIWKDFITIEPLSEMKQFQSID